MSYQPYQGGSSGGSILPCQSHIQPDGRSGCSIHHVQVEAVDLVDLDLELVDLDLVDLDLADLVALVPDWNISGVQHLHHGEDWKILFWNHRGYV